MMEASRQTKDVAFCCPAHGVLQESVEYFSVNLGTKRLANVSVMFCNQCHEG